MQHELVGGGTVLAKWSAGDLYLAVQGEGDGWSHVYVAQGDTLRVFHASAALGTAIYVRQASGSWHRSAAFDWAVRDTSFTPEADAARAAFFSDHGWIASTQRMGTTGVIELRISAARLAGDAPRLAVAFAEDPAQPRYWPSSVAGGALDARLVRGDPPATLDFEPARWAALDATR